MVLWLRRSAMLAAGVVVAVIFSVEVFAALGRPWLGLLGALAAGAGIAVSRRHPLIGLAVVISGVTWVVLFDPALNNKGSAGLLAAWILGHYMVGRWTIHRDVWVGAALVLVGLADLVFVDPAPNRGTGDIAFLLALSVLPWGAGLAMRLRAEYVAALLDKNIRLEREQIEAAARAVAAERTRIARELHDVVAHAISVTVLQTRGARRVLGPGHDDVREALDAIEQTNTAALGDMRRLLAILRDTEETAATDRAPQPSLARLSVLVDQVRSAGLPVEVTVVGTPTDVPPGVDLSAYRIVQEALTNALKHGGGATAEVTLTYSGDDMRVVVRNNVAEPGTPSQAWGRPAVAQSSGHGLLGIRERVAVVGGEVAAGPVDGGFEVAARLPYSVEVS